MWHPIIAEQESSRKIISAICELKEALYQQNLLYFGADQEKISQMNLAIEILRGNRNDLL